MSTSKPQIQENQWRAVEPDGRVRLQATACIALRLDQTSCQSCHTACPVECITISPGKFHVGVHCIGCGHCAAVCPTGALVVKGFEAVITESVQGSVRIECLKVDKRLAQAATTIRFPCLGGLSETDWLDLVMKTGTNTVQAIDRSWCGQCEVAVKMQARHPAAAALARVAQWLVAAGMQSSRLPRLITEPLPLARMPRGIPGDTPAAPSRRGFILRLGHEAKRALGTNTDAIPSPRVLRSNSISLPARERLLASLRRLAELLGQPLPAAPFQMFDIAGTCANHAICAGICPTLALTRYEDDDHVGIAFDAIRCIACGKCVAACPEHALTLRQAGTPLPDVSPVKLTAYRRRVCRECQQPYYDSADDERCPTCRRNRLMGAALFGYS
jgi:ferredoxin